MAFLDNHKFPYTDYHELNLDILLKRMAEAEATIDTFTELMKEYIRRVTLSEDNTISFYDGNGDMVQGVNKIKYAGHADTSDEATTALSASSAAIAEKANKDGNNKTISTYIASAEVNSGNTIILYDGDGEVAEQLTITSTPANSVITIKENEYSTASLFTMNVGEYDYFDSDYTLRQIQTLLTQGVVVALRKKETEMLDADFTSIIFSSVGGIFFNLLAFSGTSYTWRSFKIETDTTHEYSTGIKYQIKRVM